jgi:Pyruvate/2-oxoacid:ferredoxin oxidoreductase delta subunit
MTYTITSQCISCDRCLSSCPTNAIQHDGNTHWIDSARCNHCEGLYSVPQCWAVCPTNEGCIPFALGVSAVALSSSSESSPDYWESWFATYNRLIARLNNTKQQQSGYWQNWFDTYAKAVSHLDSTPKTV